MRAPTWLPCRLQIYFNGHNWLASQMRKRQIDYRRLDNAFAATGDWERAQQIVNGWEAKRMHRKPDGSARTYCPIFRAFGVQYHWSVDQCESSTDIVFRKQADAAAIYDNLARTAIHPVEPDNIATFLGRKRNAQCEGELGNRFNIRIEGTRIKHTMGPVSLKLYGKFGLIPRIETTVHDPAFQRSVFKSAEVGLKLSWTRVHAFRRPYTPGLYLKPPAASNARFRAGAERCRGRNWRLPGSGEGGVGGVALGDDDEAEIGRQADDLVDGVGGEEALPVSVLGTGNVDLCRFVEAREAD